MNQKQVPHNYAVDYSNAKHKVKTFEDLIIQQRSPDANPAFDHLLYPYEKELEKAKAEFLQAAIRIADYVTE